MDLKSKIRVVEDFPVKGISFKDITTLLQNGNAYAEAIEQMTKLIEDMDFDVIVSPEARGFITGGPLAVALKKGFVPVRKPGKLPHETVNCTYALEYGTDTLEIHADAIKKGMKVLIVDDLLATGGTVGAIFELTKKMGADVIGAAFLMELDFLEGRNAIESIEVRSLLHYDS